MSINDLNLEDNVKYWLYVLSKNAFDDYKKYKENYIGFMNGLSINKNDIIIIFNKERLNSGFGAIVQIEDDVVIQKEIGFVKILKDKSKKSDNQEKDIINPKIFKDNNMNRDYAKLSFKKNFTEIIKPDDVLKSLNTDATGFKNTTSFRIKYLGKDNILISFDIYGYKIVKKLLEIDDEKNSMSDNGNKTDNDSDDNDNEASEKKSSKAIIKNTQNKEQNKTKSKKNKKPKNSNK